jgi:hypothetical protein
VLEAEPIQGHFVAGRIGSIENMTKNIIEN